MMFSRAAIIAFLVSCCALTHATNATANGTGTTGGAENTTVPPSTEPASNVTTSTTTSASGTSETGNSTTSAPASNSTGSSETGNSTTSAPVNNSTGASETSNSTTSAPATNGNSTTSAPATNGNSTTSAPATNGTGSSEPGNTNSSTKPPSNVTAVVSVSMTLMNIDYQQLSADDKDELKKHMRDILAKSAGVDHTAVSVTLTPGSVKVDAEIQTPDANSAESIEMSMNENDITQEVLEAANSIPGVKAATTGELKVEGLEVKTDGEPAEETGLTTGPPASRTTSPAPEERLCEAWCKDHKSKWEEKCGFKKCNGCDPCGTDGKVLKGECVGPAECAGKEKGPCDRMRKQEGKCKWEYIKPGSVVPGECVGKRGQPECDDKDKNTCRRLTQEGKCKWLPSPKNRKTPTGDCLGEAECIGKTRRVCHRMRKQEGKCHFKPAPENTVEVSVTVKGLNLAEIDEQSQEEWKQGVTEIVCEVANEEPEACVVNFESGSVIVSAVIDLEERIGIMEGEKEGQNVNLVQEMESLKGAVQKDLEKSKVKNGILTKAKNIEGVQQAAAGDMTITDVESRVTAPAATKAPTQAPTTTTPAESSESESLTTSKFLSTSPTAPASESTTTLEGEAVSGAVQCNALGGVLIASMAAVVVQ